eukprot:scaffold91071_cov33-Tisochrysis_lutea.AAC.4
MRTRAAVATRAVKSGTYVFSSSALVASMVHGPMSEMRPSLPTRTCTVRGYCQVYSHRDTWLAGLGDCMAQMRSPARVRAAKDSNTSQELRE